MSRSTVTSTLKALKSMGYVDYEPYSLVHLTEAGMHIGRDIAHRHIVIQEFSSISSSWNRTSPTTWPVNWNT